MLGCLWNPDHIASIASACLEARARELTAEQAVRGLDALSEVELHPLLAQGLLAAGLGVHREHPYPGEVVRRPKRGERERCDLLILESPGQRLRDPVDTLKAVDAAAGTLFAGAANGMLAAEPGVEPSDVMWLEVKLVGQYTFTRGVPGPNRSYSTELLRISASDIPKLSKERLIRHSGVLLVLFTEDRRVAEHDVAAFLARCIDRELPIREPSVSGFDVPDLIGNRRCTVVLLPVRQEDSDTSSAD